MGQNERGVLTVISGPAGSGKGTVVEALRKMRDVGFSVSCTTRAPRPGEIDGVHYFFITREEFLKKIEDGEILEYNEYSGNLYGTPAKAVKDALDAGRDIVLEIDVNGGGNVKKKIPDAVTVMLLPPDAATLEARLRGRGTETEDVIKWRLERAREEIKIALSYDYVVVNYDDGIEACAAEISAIITAEHRRSEKMTAVTEGFFG